MDVDIAYKTHEVRLYPTPAQEHVMDACTGKPFEADDIEFVDDQLVLFETIPITFRGATPKRIENLWIEKVGGRWIARFLLPARVRPLPRTGQMVGCDPGVFYLLVTSDGDKIEPHDDIVKIDKRVRKQMNERDSKTIDSNRYTEWSRRIESNQKLLYDIQMDQFNKIAKYLVTRYDTIAIEEINANGKTIQHHPDYKLAAERANWSLMIEVIALRAHEAGRDIVMVPPWWTSQMCGECGYYAPKPLNKRTHYCHECGFKEERDINAAMVIRNRGSLILSGSRRTDWHPQGHPKYRPNDD